MELLLQILVGWFIISIPSSLLVGRFLASRTRPAAQPSNFSRYVSPLETQEIRVVS